MMATDERMKQMLLRLRDLTVERQQEWQRVPERVDPDFETKVGNWTVEIQTADGDGQAPFNLVIVDADGQEIETLNTVSVNPAMTPSRKREVIEQNTALREIYDASRRAATGVDTALDAINDLLAGKED